MASPPRHITLASAYAVPARRSGVIKLTPLIDVVFILLVFFMLASSFHDWRSIDLSAPGKAAGSDGLENTLLVEVRQDGFRLSGEPIGIEAMLDRISNRLAKEPEQRVLVKPVPGIALQNVVQVLDRLTAIGVSDLALMRDGGG